MCECLESQNLEGIFVFLPVLILVHRWEERQGREGLGVTTGLCQDLTCHRCPLPRPPLGRRLRSSGAAFALSLLTYQPGGEVRVTVLGSSATWLTSSSTSQTRSEDTSQRPVARGLAGLGLAAAKTHPKSSSCYCYCYYYYSFSYPFCLTLSGGSSS